MKKVTTISLLFFIVLFTSPLMVCAIESESEETCDYKTQANLNKMAASVTASYNIEKKEDGSNVFKISVYNIVDPLYVSVQDESENFSLNITPAQLNNGVYTFDIDNDTDVIKYNFVVRSLSTGCNGDIKKFSLIKPKKNKYHDYDECKYSDTEKYSYCEEWITKDFTLSESQILEKINEQRSIVKNATTVICKECEETVRKAARLKKISIIKRITVIVLSILIALDIIYIYVKSCRIKDAEI